MIEAPARSDHLAPWQAQRFQLWSLLTMLQLYATDFLMVLETMARAKGFFHPANDEETRKLGRLQLGLAMTLLRTHAANLPLSHTFLAEVDRLRKKADDQHEIYNVDDLSLLLNELEMNLRNELKSHLFLSLRNEFRVIYDNPEGWYGEEVASVFPGAVDYMRDCGQCLALERWTASVFHAMAVLHFGLQDLAERLKVKFSQPFELMNWHNVLTEIEARIAVLQQKPKSLKKDAELERYSKAVIHFRYFKDAWRNHVSHARKRYDEQEAMRVAEHVRDFMREIASWH